MKRVFFSLIATLIVVIIIASAVHAGNDYRASSSKHQQQQSVFSLSAATRAWWLSKIDACPGPSAESFTCGPCMQLAEGLYPGQPASVKPDKLSHVRSFTASLKYPSVGHATVAYSAAYNQVLLIYRGTRELGWLYDLDFSQVPYQQNDSRCSMPAPPSASTVGEYPCMVHDGFLKDFELLKQNGTHIYMLELLQQYPSATIQVSGHSLGSALTMLGAAEVALNASFGRRARNMQVIGFGSPRVFNHAGAKFVSEIFEHLNVSVTRIVNGADLVPKIPLLNMAFIHLAGTEVWFANGRASASTNSSDASAVAQTRICSAAPGQEAMGCSNQLSILKVVPADHTWFCGTPPCVPSGCS